MKTSLSPPTGGISIRRFGGTGLREGCEGGLCIIDSVLSQAAQNSAGAGKLTYGDNEFFKGLQY